MTIEVAKLTAGEVEGAGLFEEIMRTVLGHITNEYAAGRIAGDDYANVYLGSLTAALQTASQFVLQYETQNQQTLLLSEQVQGQQKTNELIQEQINNAKVQVQISTRQLDVITSQIALTDAQELQADQQTALLAVQVTNAGKQGQLIDEQVLSTREATAFASQNRANALTQNTNLVKQQEKLTAETTLLTNKTYTEQAQIQDTANGLPVLGVIGKQKDLYTRQADGFLRDAEQKAAKVFSDTWTVRQTTDGALAGPAGLDDAQVQRAMTKLLTGVDA